MKRLISILLTISIAAAALAQPQGAKKGPGAQGRPDFEKMKAERVAFITSEVGLTAQEAEAFWPVYNEIENQQVELMKAEKKAYMELSKALKGGEGNVQALLDAYLKAKGENVNLHVANAKKYQKVLSVEKTAKFFTCEEKFRRQQIGKLGGGRDQRRPEMRDGKGPRDGKASKTSEKAKKN